MIDPIQAFEIMAQKPSLALPSASPTPIPGVPKYEQLGELGDKTLWIVFVLMFLSTLVFALMAYRLPVQKRLFPVLTAFITATATLSYFAMATGDGATLHETIVRTTHKHSATTVQHIFRQVYFARYIDWTITTPLLLLDLSFLAGLNGSNIIVTIFADIVMCLTGLFAAYGNNTTAKWGWYAMGCAAYLVIVFQLVIPGRKAVAAKDNKTATLFAAIGGYTLVLWTLYPVVWGIGDGARIWSVDAEIVSYAILDVLAKPIFGFWLLIAHADKTSIDGFWTHGLSSEGAIRIDDDEGR